MDGFRRLDEFVRKVEESTSPKANFERAMQREKDISVSLGGRTVFDDKKKTHSSRGQQQMSLFE
jgi:uncharacterized protein